MSDNRDDVFEELLGLYKNELMLALPHSARAEEKNERRKTVRGKER